MNKWRVIIIALLGMVQLTAIAKPKDKNPEEPKRVYLYGVAMNFNDSTVYITDVQHLDSIIIHDNGCLQNYSNYSMQWKVYLEGTLNELNQTCAVIYSDKKKKLDKSYLKTRKKYTNDKSKTLKQVGTDAFAFQKR